MCVVIEDDRPERAVALGRGVPAAWPWPFRRFRDVMAEPDLSAFQL